MYSISAIQSRVLFLYVLLTMLLLISHSDYWFWTGKKNIAKNSRKLHNAVLMKVTQYNHEFLRRHHLSFK